MNLDEIKQILEMMREHELAEFELERQDTKLRLRKNMGQWAAPMAPGAAPTAYPAPQPLNPAGAPGTDSAAAGPVLTSANEDVDFAIVKSPIVGTFYRSSEP